MDWTAAIERQRLALRDIVATLAAMTGCGAPPPRQDAAADDSADAGAAGACPTLPRHLYRAVLRLLRPAEAAARRLVIALAHTLPAPQLQPRPARKAASPCRPTILKNGIGTGIVLPREPQVARPRPDKMTLPLFDRLRMPVFGHRARRRVHPASVPRISVPGIGRPFPIKPYRPPLPDDPIDATRLSLRLRALAAVLDDPAAQARRFARWQARMRRESRAASDAPWRPRRISPLKPGRPPGSLRRPFHPVHTVLGEAQWLASSALERRDTS